QRLQAALERPREGRTRLAAEVSHLAGGAGGAGRRLNTADPWRKAQVSGSVTFGQLRPGAACDLMRPSSRGDRMKTIHIMAAAVGLATLCGCAEFDQWVEADPYFAGYDQGAYGQQQCVGYANTGPGGSDNGRPLASDGYSTWT